MSGEGERGEAAERALALTDDQLADELLAVARGFAMHLSQADLRGRLGVPAGVSPRFGVADVVAAAARAEAPQPRARAEAPAPREAAPAATPTAAAAAAAGVGESEPHTAEPSALELRIDDGTLAPAERLDALREHIGPCQRCRLAGGRKHVVFGVGNPDADLMFVGEAPGFDEDAQGIPFVGKAGQLLSRMIKAMGLDRDEVYIANIIKCRPPRNRDPEPDEIAACEPFLKKQIDIVAPRLLVALGSFAAKTLLRTRTGIMRLRGKWRAYHGIPLMPTFHPAYLLRNEAGKRPVWQDLQQVMAEMDRLELPRRRS